MRELPSGSAQEEQADQDIMRALAAGERAAMARLYERHSDRMMGLAYRLLGNRRDAEDLLHDVFLEVWAKAASYSAERASVRAWLLLRVRSRSIDRLRGLTLARRHAMAERAPASEVVVPVFEPEQAAERVGLRRLLDCLSETQRKMVELSYFAGLTHQEIAARCEIPVGTVKSRLAAATERLRRGLRLGAEEDSANRVRKVAGES